VFTVGRGKQGLEKNPVKFAPKEGSLKRRFGGDLKVNGHPMSPLSIGEG